MQGTRRNSSGFSLIELLTVVLLIGIIGGMAIFGIQSVLPTVWSDAAMNRVVTFMRLGRETAVTQRRPVDVRFTPPNRIDLVRIDAAGETPLSTVELESNPSFILTPGLPDTPDAFGNGEPVDFDGSDTIRFLADGTLSDGVGIPLNGSIFIGTAGNPLASRAITVTGVTGRATPYRWTGNQWEER
jgi:prepilin-type N-terminal cleavage/methylation domain-containing protein